MVRKLGALLAFAYSVVSMNAMAARPLVAVIDSGIARTPELQSALVGEIDLGAERTRPAYQPRYDHGTMVATILKRAMDKDVGILSIRIDDPAGCPRGAAPPCQPDAAPIARAIRLAASMKVDAINISLALKDDPMIVEAIRDAARQGIFIALAAGNNGFDHPGNLGMARAGFPQAVLVGAVDAAGKPWNGTNRPGNPGQDGYNYVWGLGVEVPTSSLRGEPIRATGTSFAVPIEVAKHLSGKEHGPQRGDAIKAAATPQAQPSA